MKLINMHPDAQLAVQAAIFHSCGSPITPWLESRQTAGKPPLRRKLYDLACHLGEETKDMAKTSEVIADAKNMPHWIVEKGICPQLPLSLRI